MRTANRTEWNAGAAERAILHRRGCYYRCRPDTIDRADDKEYRKGDDRKLQDCVQKHPIIQRWRVMRLRFGQAAVGCGRQVNEQILEVDVLDGETDSGIRISFTSEFTILPKRRR